MAIDISKYTAHQHPGKFEGEMPATEYFYEQMMNGDGEELWYSHSDSTPDISGVLFHIDAEEADAFGLNVGHWFLLRCDSAGYVFGSQHPTRRAAEDKFKEWVA